MSELNVYHHELRPGEYAEFYLKYEADKVIEDLEEKYLNDLLDAEDCFRSILELNRKEIRHQKYKRCLDKAKWCIAEAKVSDDEYRMYWWVDWHKRWLELAEKFKEDLVIGVDKAIGTDKTVVINHEEAK